jgi:hypothetical protein
MFSVGSAPRLYNEDLTQLELGIGSSSGDGCRRPVRRNSKKEIRMYKEYFMCDLKLQ